MTVIDSVQWLVIAGLAVLVLGLYRQLAIFLTPPTRTLESMAGPEIGERLPSEARQILSSKGMPTDREVTLAFVSESCRGCQVMIAKLTRLIASSDPRVTDTVVVALNPSGAMLRALEEAGIQYIEDDGELWGLLDVQATPFLVDVGRKGIVRRKAVDHRVEHFLDSAAA